MYCFIFIFIKKNKNQINHNLYPEDNETFSEIYETHARGDMLNRWFHSITYQSHPLLVFPSCYRSGCGGTGRSHRRSRMLAWAICDLIGPSSNRSTARHSSALLMNSFWLIMCFKRLLYGTKSRHCIPLQEDNHYTNKLAFFYFTEFIIKSSFLL